MSSFVGLQTCNSSCLNQNPVPSVSFTGEQQIDLTLKELCPLPQQELHRCTDTTLLRDPLISIPNFQMLT